MRKVFFGLMLKITFFQTGRFRGRFLRKVPRKVFVEGDADVFVEGVCERFFGVSFREGFRKDSGWFWAFANWPCRNPSRRFLTEGSPEGFCGRFCGRFLRKVPRKVPGRFSAEGQKELF